MLQHVQIQKFRGFSALDLNDLGRVNLIVGRNNAGKTSFLEALALLANPKLIGELPGLLRAKPVDVDGQFYRWLRQDSRNDEQPTLLAAHLPDGQRQVLLLKKFPSEPFHEKDFASMGPQRYFTLVVSKNTSDLGVNVASVQHKAPQDLVRDFNKAMLSPDSERQMEEILSKVDPRIRSIRLSVAEQTPSIVVDVGLQERIPLSQAGQGIYRLVSIFSELLGAKPNLCFIDEIENGIHFSALPTVWKGIAEISKRLDIQVFATTHSNECLRAADEVFRERGAYDFRVIQLFRGVKDGASDGRLLDEEHIKAALDGDLELR